MAMTKTHYVRDLKDQGWPGAKQIHHNTVITKNKTKLKKSEGKKTTKNQNKEMAKLTKTTVIQSVYWRTVWGWHNEQKIVWWQKCGESLSKTWRHFHWKGRCIFSVNVSQWIFTDQACSFMLGIYISRIGLVNSI